MAIMNCAITECSVLSNKKAPLKAYRKLFSLPLKNLFSVLFIWLLTRNQKKGTHLEGI